MKKLVLMVAVLTATMMTGCEGGCTGNQDPDPNISNHTVSDCKSHTDQLAAKDMSTDSVVVSWTGDHQPMQVTHYNMLLDCGQDDIGTSIELSGNIITVTEHVGDQGLTNCICFYDNSFQINNLPERPFILIIKVESLFMGNLPELTTVYQQTFE